MWIEIDVQWQAAFSRIPVRPEQAAEIIALVLFQASEGGEVRKSVHGIRPRATRPVDGGQKFCDAGAPARVVRRAIWRCPVREKLECWLRPTKGRRIAYGRQWDLKAIKDQPATLFWRKRDKAPLEQVPKRLVQPNLQFGETSGHVASQLERFQRSRRVCTNNQARQDFEERL
jgi:hypothetical protein